MGVQLLLIYTLVTIQFGCWAITRPLLLSPFHPTPIPLYWTELESSRTAKEVTADVSIPPFVALPDVTTATTQETHAWEDTLRHSVYLTLLRDRVDKLIAKGDIITGEGSYYYEPQAERDNDLWNKIKSAPFDRQPSMKGPLFGDIATLSTGSLMREKEAFRFIEDDRKECGDDACKVEGDVEARWGIRRIRHRDFTDPPVFRYELSFSVETPNGREQVGYLNPARTFTYPENMAEPFTEWPERRKTGDRVVKSIDVESENERTERTYWVHKNIEPYEYLRADSYDQQLNTGEVYGETDRKMYSPYYEEPNKNYRPWGPPEYNHKVKIPLSELQQQKKLALYPWKQPVKPRYPRPPMVSHMHHHYLDFESIGVVSSPYVTNDHRYFPTKISMPPNLKSNSSTFNVTKPTPTPSKASPTPLASAPSYTAEPYKYGSILENKKPYVFKGPPGSLSPNYIDSKPFVPFPSKSPINTHYGPPADFRPSPQVIEMQFSDPDPLFPPAMILTDKHVNITRNHLKNIPSNVTEVETDVTTEIILITDKPDPSIFEDLEGAISWSHLFGPITESTTMESLRITSKKPPIQEPTSEIYPDATVSPSEKTLRVSRITTTKMPTTTQEMIKERKVRTTTTTTTTTTSTSMPKTEKTTETSKPVSEKPVEQTTTTTEAITERPFKTEEKNRFRQSSIMLKGSTPKEVKKNIENNKYVKASQSPYKWVARRTTSNFQGYSFPSTTLTAVNEDDKEDETTEIIYITSQEPVKDSLSEQSSSDITVVTQQGVTDENDGMTTTVTESNDITSTVTPVYSVIDSELTTIEDSIQRPRPVVFSLKTNNRKYNENKQINSTISENDIKKIVKKCKNKKKVYTSTPSTMTTESGLFENVLEPLTKKTLVTSISFKIGNETREYVKPTSETTPDEQIEEEHPSDKGLFQLEVVTEEPNEETTTEDDNVEDIGDESTEGIRPIDFFSLF